MGIGERRCGCLAFVTFYLGDALPRRRLLWAMSHLGDASSWRRPAMATLALGVASPRRHLMFTLTPTLALTLTCQRPGTGRYTSPTVLS